MQQDERTVVVGDPAALGAVSTRRRFLRALGMGGSIVLLPSVFAACEDSTSSVVSPEVADAYNRGQTVTLDLSNDIGIFNYAYALEQLEAAFYSQVVALPNFATLFPDASEQEALTDIRNDEVTHRQFYAVALGDAAIPQLSVDFGTNLGTRQGILTLARTFEDLGVAAYNGAGQYLRNANNLLVAGKIVSVEARHAAALRDIGDTSGVDTSGVRFADLSSLTAFGASDANALDGALAPDDVLRNAAPFLTRPVAIGTQPTA
jgi:hypothetical protein